MLWIERNPLFTGEIAAEGGFEEVRYARGIACEEALPLRGCGCGGIFQLNLFAGLERRRSRCGR
jgi:hypothetical protein